MSGRRGVFFIFLEGEKQRKDFACGTCEMRGQGHIEKNLFRSVLQKRKLIIKRGVHIPLSLGGRGGFKNRTQEIKKVMRLRRACLRNM